MPLPSDQRDLERRWAGIQAHNRWLVDFCSELPAQRRGLVQVFPHQIEAAVEEVRWAAEQGVVGGVLIPAIPPNHATALPLYSGFYDPLWAAIEEAGLGEHIAGAVLFLASDDARFVTGEALVVDGGLMAAGPNLVNRLREPGSPSVMSLGVSGVDKGSTGQPPVIRPKSS